MQRERKKDIDMQRERERDIDIYIYAYKRIHKYMSTENYTHHVLVMCIS